MAMGANISPSQGGTYYQKDDYYLQREGGEEYKLEWGGKLSQELGLIGKANEDDWKKALNGELPGGIKINGGTFRDKNGEVQRRAGTDFVIEAPKSISMLYGDTQREDIKAAILEQQAKVVKATMAFYEEKNGIRERKGAGVREFRETGKSLFGTVRHFTNRDGQIFIHDHGIQLNVAQNPDGTYRAMTNDRMMSYQGLNKELGDSMWAKWAVEHGLGIEKGKYGEVQIAGYTREQIEYHSGRGKAIETYLKEHFGTDRKNSTQEQRDEAWKMTRKSKTIKELGSVEAKHQDEMKASGGHEVTLKLEELFKKDAVPELSQERRLAIAKESLEFAIEHHTERESAVPEGELLRTALKAGRGKIEFSDLKIAFSEAKEKGDIIRQSDHLSGTHQNLVTSRESLEREKRILSFEKTGRGAVEPVMNPLQAENALKAIQEKEGLILNNEQKAAARMILTTNNRYVGINGYAGVGKTTMLKPAVEILKESGIKVIGLGPQHSAVHALKDAGILESGTLQSWLIDRQAGKSLDDKTVVVIDEAGLTNAQDLEYAARRIEKAGARAVLVGDIKQYESVSAGPAFDMLQKSGMETVYVTEMQRQNKAAENVKEAARLSVDSPGKALEKLEVREIQNAEERYKSIADEYLKSTDPSETLVLTGTHEARRAVNTNIREALGLSGKGNEFTRFEAGDFTEAQKKRIDTYDFGQQIQFGKEYKSLGIEKGEIGKVQSIDKKNGVVMLKMTDGRDVMMKPHKLSGKSHEIGKVEKIELTSGDRIRITGNERKKEGITNGMRGEVIESKPDSLKIRLDNGKTFEIKPDGRPIETDHGYAQTGHSAQGLGAKIVIIDLPADSRTVNLRSFYTNLTRTKETVAIFTDDRVKITGAVGRESNKTLAHDINKNMNLEEKATKICENIKKESAEKDKEKKNEQKTGKEEKKTEKLSSREKMEILLDPEVSDELKMAVILADASHHYDFWGTGDGKEQNPEIQKQEVTPERDQKSSEAENAKKEAETARQIDPEIREQSREKTAKN